MKTISRIFLKPLFNFQVCLQLQETTIKISHKSLNFHTHSLVGTNLRSTNNISEALFRIHDIQGVAVLTKILIEHFALTKETLVQNAETTQESMSQMPPEKTMFPVWVLGACTASKPPPWINSGEYQVGSSDKAVIAYLVEKSTAPSSSKGSRVTVVSGAGTQ